MKTLVGFDAWKMAKHGTLGKQAGAIAGLSCAEELARLSEQFCIPVENIHIFDWNGSDWIIMLHEDFAELLKDYDYDIIEIKNNSFIFSFNCKPEDLAYLKLVMEDMFIFVKEVE